MVDKNELVLKQTCQQLVQDRHVARRRTLVSNELQWNGWLLTTEYREVKAIAND